MENKKKMKTVFLITEDYLGDNYCCCGSRRFAQKRDQEPNPVKCANTFALCNCPCSYVNPVVTAP